MQQKNEKIDGKRRRETTREREQESTAALESTSYTSYPFTKAELGP